MAFQKNKSIEDAIKVLMAIAGSGKPYGTMELSKALGMESTRVNRILKTLQASGFVEQDLQRRYHSGPGINMLAAKSLHGSMLLRAALPIIETVSPAPYTVGLGVLYQDEVSYLFHATPGVPFAEGFGRLNYYEATHSSIGLMLLALQPEEAVAALYEERDEIPGYFRDYRELSEKLSEFREANAAVMPSFNEPGEFTLAVSVGEPVLGALSFATIAEHEIEARLGLLREKAALIAEGIRERVLRRQGHAK